MNRLFRMTPNLRAAVLSYGLWSLAYNVIAPLIPLLSAHIGATPLEVGLVATSTLAGAAALTLPLSYVSDRFGRRSALVTAWLLSGSGMLLMSLAHSVLTLIPGAALSGAVVASLPTLNVLVMEESAPADRTHNYVIFYAAGPAGTLLGSWLGGLTAQTLGLAAACAVSGVLVLLSTISLAAIRPRRPQSMDRPTVPETSDAATPRLRDQALIAILAGIGYMLVALPGNFVFLYLHTVRGVDLRSTGELAGLLGGSQLLWSFVLLNLPHDERKVRLPFVRITMSKTNAIGLAITLAGNALFGVLLPLGSVVAWMLALTLRGSYYVLHSLGSAVFSDIINTDASPTLRMTGMSFPVGLGAMAAPVLGGWLYAFSPSDPFWISAAACAAAVAIGVAFLLASRAAGAEASAGA